MPPAGVAVAVASQAPLQEGEVKLPATVNKVGAVIITIAFEEQPFASVTVTE